MNTLILKWNPAISSVSMDDMKEAIDDMWDSLDVGFNWSIYDWEKAGKGDRVFFLRVGRGKTGIMASGWLFSDLYLDDDWRGSGDKRHYADIIFDFMIFPHKNNILDTRTLRKEIPSVEWDGGHSGVCITEDEACKLEQVWKEFLHENEHQFDPKAKYTFRRLEPKAWSIAYNAHKGQVDKAGKDYFEAHVKDVHERVEYIFDKDSPYDLTAIVALLHDIVEDTDWTIERLRDEGFPEDVLTILDCVTKREDEDYGHFIERIKPNRYARAVKIADLESNMDIKRLNEITDEDVERLRKYLKAYKYLTAE